MIEKQKISQRQAFYFALTTGFGTIVYLHAEVIALGGRAGWVAELAGTALLVPLALWTLFLGRLAPGLTILEILEQVAGKIIGKFVGVVYMLISVVVTVLVLQTYGTLLKVFTLPETPNWLPVLMVLVLSVLMASGGVELLGRLGELLAILLVSIFFLGVGPGLLTLNTAYLYPVTAQTSVGFLAGTYLSAGSLGELALFLLIMVAALPQPAESYGTMTKAILTTGFIASMVVLILIGFFSAPEAARLPFGGFNLAQNVQVGKFIQGVDVFVQFTFVLLTLMKVAAHVYGGWAALAGVCHNWRPRVLLAGLTLLIAYLATRLLSFNETYFLMILLARYVTLPFVVFVLLVTSIGVLLRGGKVAGK